MKKLTLTIACFAVILFVLIAPVQASVSVMCTIGDDIYVTYHFENLDPTVYNEATANPQLFNGSTIPRIIVRNLEQQGLTHVNYGFQPNANDDATKTIRASFYLSGSDIISFTINRTTMRRTYQAKTEWRKFQLNLTTSFYIDFAQILTKPVKEWQKINGTGYFYQSEKIGFLDVSFQIVLPETATKAQAEGDTITFEVPPRQEDVFLNSPFLILAVLIIIIIIALIYRRVR